MCEVLTLLAGCAIGINDLTEDDDAKETISLLEAAGAEAAFFAADVSDAAQVHHTYFMTSHFHPPNTHTHTHTHTHTDN